MTELHIAQGRLALESDEMHILYYSPGACSLAPHILFEETGIPFEPRRISFANGQHLSPEYLKLNPRGRVPTLLIGNQAVTEAPALLLYIASLAPGHRLTPPAGEPYARCLEWLFFLSSSLHIAYAQFWRPARFLPEGSEAAALIAQGRENIAGFNSEIESRIGVAWALGDDYSVVDAYLLPFYRWGVRIGLDMGQICPNWTQWKDRMLTRPAVLRAIAREGIGTAWSPS